VSKAKDARKVRAGQAIRKAREAHGWRQAEDAVPRLNLELERHAPGAGRARTVTQSAWSRWERGETSPEHWKWPAIEDVLAMERGILAEILQERKRPTTPVGELLTNPRAVVNEMRKLVEALERMLPEDAARPSEDALPARPLQAVPQSTRGTGTRGR
jgi:transcriptional regulator with XRE-family HTH domain